MVVKSKSKSTPKKVTKTTKSAAKSAKSAKSTKGKVTATPVTVAPATVVVPATVATTTTTTATPVVVATVTPSLGDAFGELLAQLHALRSQLTTVTTQVRTLQKRSERELKNALKANKKRARKAGNRAPSGFVKPTKISKELASFLGKPHGTEMARTEVTKEINGYIRAHKLQDPTNGRIILADAKLRKLLKLKKDDKLTYFNLQRFMSPHFAKSVKKTTVTA
jgi:chromatin remodeling complex protein RSC6